MESSRQPVDSTGRYFIVFRINVRKRMIQMGRCSVFRIHIIYRENQRLYSYDDNKLKIDQFVYLKYKSIC
jgi:hypothetical protein